MLSSPVIRDADFQRITALPRRDITPTEELVRVESERYRKPGSTATLFPVQALALSELRTHMGLFGALPVGSGKTLISLLASTVVGGRGLIVVPASLRKKTYQELGEYSKDWAIRPNFQVRSYQELARVSRAEYLQKYKPSVIVFDEAHMLKNRSAAVTKRVSRYLRQNPETKCVFLSGTVTTRSISDYAHLMHWALKDGSPVPKNPMHVQMWASFLDARSDAEHPGVLLELSPVHEEDSTVNTPKERARLRYKRRLHQTPGVLIMDSHGFAGSLTISKVDVPGPQEIKDVFDELQNTGEIPSYLAVDDPLALWRVTNQISTGLIYYWDPPPPYEWTMARSVWYGTVRETLSRSRKYDSPQQLELATLAGETKLIEQLKPWIAVRGTYRPEVKAKWLGDHMVKACRKYRKGIIWCNIQEAAVRIARELDVPYYGAKGLDNKGRQIEKAKGLIVASIDANCTGRNLQQFSHNIVVTPALPSHTWNQLIGRTHRTGQKEDEVTVDILFSHDMIRENFERALIDAKYAQQTTGETNKLLLATTIER